MEPESSGNPLVDGIMRAIGRLIPSPHASTVTREQRELLMRRNRWLDGISQVLSVGGFLGGLCLPFAARGRPLQLTAWDLGVQLGLGVGLPVLFIVLATVSRDRQRLRDFLEFYSVKYGVDARKLFLLGYAPIIGLGLVSAFFAYGHHHD